MDWYNSDEDNFSVNSDDSYVSDEHEGHRESLVNEGVKESEVKASLEKITSEESIDLTEENVTCQICYKYALNAVICLNERCKKNLCDACANNTKTLNNKCPFCRIEPFNYQSSPYAKQINKMQFVCLLCKEKYVLQQEDKHYKLNCSYFQSIQCMYCPSRFNKNEIVKHTKTQHPKQIEEMIYNQYVNPPPQHNAKLLLEKNKLYLQKIDKRPKIGTTGKFYCGGKLETKCTCCNGYCGPTNGENCNQCMKLDIKKSGLKKGFLVNSAGHVCYLKGNDFVCGVRLNYQQGECSQGNTCRSCANMKKNIKRYQDLI